MQLIKFIDLMVHRPVKNLKMSSELSKLAFQLDKCNCSTYQKGCHIDLNFGTLTMITETVGIKFSYIG